MRRRAPRRPLPPQTCCCPLSTDCVSLKLGSIEWSTRSPCWPPPFVIPGCSRQRLGQRPCPIWVIVGSLNCCGISGETSSESLHPQGEVYSHLGWGAVSPVLGQGEPSIVRCFIVCTALANLLLNLAFTITLVGKAKQA